MIELLDVTVEAGKFELLDVNMKIESGKYGILIGKTGSGKTTILESICGLKKTKCGDIYIENQIVTNLRPSERGIGFVPQDGALFETKSVYENIIFSLKLRKWPQEKIKNRASELAALLKIEHLLERSVHFLSGGEKQRVSLARALAFYPKVLCLDEPLSALDSDTHQEICQLLKTIQKHTKTTVIHISHNPTEVKFLADICYQIKDNQVQLIDVNDTNLTQRANT